FCFPSLLPPMLREITRVTLEQRGHIVRHEVNLPANCQVCARLQPAKSKVRMHTARDSLEKFLIRFPGRRKNQALVRAKTANQSVAGDQRAQGTRICITTRNLFRTPNLPRRVASFRCPWASRQPGQLALDENETFAEIIV